MLTPADELLVCCARVSLDVETETRLSALIREPLDWPYVLSKSWWHRIRPLVHLHLHTQPAGVVPDEILKQLSDAATELAARNLRLASALAEVAALFEQRQLRMLVFKGPTLSEDAYGNLGLRECGDLDLLVHPDDFPSVHELLGEHGFTSAWDRTWQKRQTFGCEFLRNETELDVHWDLAPAWLNYRVDFDRLWTDGSGLDTTTTFSRKLRPEDAVVVLCIHGTKHWWERLRWICDIAELVNRHQTMDWDRVYAAADRANARRTVELGLRLAGDLLSAQLPARIKQYLSRSPVVQRQSSQVTAWLARDGRGAGQRRLGERFLFRLRLCERARDRIPQLLHYLWAAPNG